jgi:DNA-binding XRE family transcriptional regulator
MRGQAKLAHLDGPDRSIGPLRELQPAPTGVHLSLESILAIGATRDLRRRAAHAFGQALRAVRSAQGFTQEKLAQRCQFNRTYLSLLEGGRRTPTFTMIIKLGHALNVDPMELFASALANLRAEVK